MSTCREALDGSSVNDGSSAAEVLPHQLTDRARLSKNLRVSFMSALYSDMIVYASSSFVITDLNCEMFLMFNNVNL